MWHDASKVWAAPSTLTSFSISASRGMQAPHFHSESGWPWPLSSNNNNLSASLWNASCSVEFKKSKSIYFRMGWVSQCWRDSWMSQVKGLGGGLCEDKQMCQTKLVSLSSPKHTSRCPSFSLKTHTRWQQQMDNVQNE